MIHKEKLKVTLIISSLSSGGAERVMSMLANHWSQDKYDITLITLASVDLDFYHLSNKVRRIPLDLMKPSKSSFHAVIAVFSRLKAIRSAIKNSEANIVISFVDRTNILTILSSRWLNVPVIVSERTDPRHHKIGLIWNFFRKLLYKYSDALIVQTMAVKEWANNELPGVNAFSLPNPVEIPDSDIVGNHELMEGKVIVSVGRLGFEKGHDVLLRAFKLCHQKDMNWRLVIFGDGPEKPALESYIKEHNLSDFVYLPGRILNPNEILPLAKIFVLPSRYEGFPNALLEAMASGLPVISTNCDSGPSEIISNGNDGMLVPVDDAQALANILLKLMASPSDRKRLGSAALHTVQRYEIGNVIKMWESVIYEVLDNNTVNNL